jgi:poly [ADP-ribose] polymerase 2/3/4
MNDKLGADYNAHNLPEGYHSTRGVGKSAPSSQEEINGVLIPNGVLAPTNIEGASLMYNEYVVYNRDQVLCRYIVHVKFHFK